MLRAAPPVWATALSIETAMKYPVSRLRSRRRRVVNQEHTHTRVCGFSEAELGLFLLDIFNQDGFF